MGTFDFSLEGRVCLVTGGSRTLGASIVRTLAEHGGRRSRQLQPVGGRGCGPVRRAALSWRPGGAGPRGRGRSCPGVAHGG